MYISLIHIVQNETSIHISIQYKSEFVCYRELVLPYGISVLEEQIE